MDQYEQWVQSKSESAQSVGLAEISLTDAMYPHQRDITSWALKKGRAAIFADTGLGKTLMQVEWARIVSEQAGKVLILAPLAVSSQTVAEAARFGVEVMQSRDGSCPGAITITNYEMLDRFDPSDYAGIVLDESSILKAYTGKTRTEIIDSFKDTPYRLACTATPSPNDHTELGNHSEFLGVKSRVEMLAEYFVHDGGSTQNWRLKGHAEDAFWRWVSSWAIVLKRPSDLGHDDAGFDLPPLRMAERIVSVDHGDAKEAGLLFAPQARTLSDQRATRRMTKRGRVDIARQIAEEHPDDQLLVWCELNAEGDAVQTAIPGSVQVKGSDSPEEKAANLLGFADGSVRVLVTKPSIAGFGMNWQRCHRMIFIGASHSYEQTYQAIRRCWRFGQEHPVDVVVIRAETEDAVVANFKRKEAAAERMAAGMLDHVREAQRCSIATGREWNEYSPGVRMAVPSWVGREECRT